MTRRISGRISLPKGAAELLHAIAKRENVTPREYIEALLHYAGSINIRPGSWEASKPFDLADYIGDEAYADRWFNDEGVPPSTLEGLL